MIRRFGVAVILLLLAVPSFAALNAYLKMDTIPGESTDPSHAGWIDIESWSWGASRVMHGSAASAPAHCTSHSLNFVKRLDKASPLLSRAALSGTPIPNVTLEINGERHMLQNVVIASVQQSQMDGRPAESLTLNFARCATHEIALATPPGFNHKIELVPNGILIGLTPRPESLSLASLNFLGTTQATLTRKAGGDPSGVLMRACANGKHFPTVTITTRTGQKWTFSDVSLSPTGPDSFSLNFAKVDGPMNGFQDLAYKE